MTDEQLFLDDLLAASRPSRVRSTGIQTAMASVRAQLAAFEQTMSPVEYATLVDVAGRMFEHERRRTSRWLRRRPA